MLPFRKFYLVAKDAAVSWYRHQPLRESAVIAFFAIISMPALLVVVIHVAGLIYEKQDIKNELARQAKTALNTKAVDTVLRTIDKASDEKKGAVATIVSIGFILFGSSRVFMQLKKSFNIIWGFEAQKHSFVKALVKMLFSIGMALSLGFLLLVSMVISTVLAAASAYIKQFMPDFILYFFFVIEFLTSLVIVSALFALMFLYLPEKRPPLKAALAGALLTGVLFTILKTLLSFIFAAIDPGSVYGSAGYLVVLMLWLSAASMTVFYGARFVRQFEIFRRNSLSDA